MAIPKRFKRFKPPESGLKALYLDIETAPIEAFVWGIWEQNVGLNQIKQDWTVLCWSAKWHGHPDSKIMYMGLENSKDVRNDKEILEELWALIDEADIVIGHNIRKFDLKKIYARFIKHGLTTPTHPKILDTLESARSKFGFTSNSLEYLADYLGVKYKKFKHDKFPGFDLWTACLKKVKAAWAEMRKYNMNDIKTLEGVFKKMQPYDTRLTFYYFTDLEDFHCNCGSENFMRNGSHHTQTLIYERLICKDCGTPFKLTKKGVMVALK